MSSTNPLTIKFHNALYNEEAITQAAASFEDFASFTVRSDGDHYVVDVTDINTDVEGDVVAEFCNFALANTITRGQE